MITIGVAMRLEKNHEGLLDKDCTNWLKVKIKNATKYNIKTQKLTMSVDIKCNGYLQLLNHQGRASSNHNHVWRWKRFRLPVLLLWINYWPRRIKLAWHHIISCTLSVLFCSGDIIFHKCKFLHQQSSSRTQVSVVCLFLFSVFAEI